MSIDIIKPMQTKMVKEVLSIKDDPFFDQLKKEANRLYSASQFTEAISLYSRVIDSNPPFNQLVTIITNRAQCWLKLNQFHKALEDSDSLIQSFFAPINDPKDNLWPKELKRIYAKALMRRGQALLGLGNRYGALRAMLDFERYTRESNLVDLKLDGNSQITLNELSRSPMDQFKESLPCERVEIQFSGNPPLLIEGKWMKLNADVKSRPKARESHASVYFEGEIWIFGGKNTNENEFGDMWAFNLTNQKWREIKWKGESPSKRSCTMLVWDGIFYLFGSSESESDDKLFWTFDPKQSKWTRMDTKKEIKLPALRGHRATLCHTRRSMIVFGGEGHDFDGDKNRNFGDLLEYSFVTNQWKRWPKSSVLGISPMQRRSHIQWIIGNDLYVLFGMADPPHESVPDTTLEDFWKMDLRLLDSSGPVWAPLSLQGNVPEPRAKSVAVVRNGQAVLFGGYSTSLSMHFTKTKQVMQYNYMGDALVFTPGKKDGHWAFLNGKGERPSNRAGTFLVADEVGNVYTVFGSTNVSDKMHDMNDIHKLDFTQTAETALKIPPFHPDTVKTSKLHKKTCSRCKLVFDTKLGQCGFKCGTYYCSIDCQTKHWDEEHNRTCVNARDPSKVTNLDEMD
eukprot:TRINITY_DN5360_c0_g1_i1.p1 TRINITY_DN5360_c0_g1~~TRINITY_DN5360_c0_g1_i1.p1  ORF type:complete len:624 (-),score=151.27 TRINITY_DN5360_c0_g1_i1:82-1953(-)